MTKTAKSTPSITGDAKKTLEEGVEKMTKGFENATTFGQDNIEAVVTSSKIAAKAAEGVNAEIVAFSKKTYEDGMAAAKELSTCKSVSEFVEKQAEFSRATVEGFIAEATKLNEMYAAAAKEALAPLNARFTAAVEMVREYRA